MPVDAERKGIGTPATRAAVLEKLVSSGFVERRKSRKASSLIPSALGTALITVLPEALQSPLLTAEWEHRLITKSVAAALLKDGKALLSGCHSEKTQKTYDATVVMQDDGKQVSFKLEFAKRSRKE